MKHQTQIDETLIKMIHANLLTNSIDRNPRCSMLVTLRARKTNEVRQHNVTLWPNDFIIFLEKKGCAMDKIQSEANTRNTLFQIKTTKCRRKNKTRFRTVVPRRDCLSGKIHDRVSCWIVHKNELQVARGRTIRFRTYSERGIKTEKSVCHL